MALACGVTVANIYMCQPLLAEFARDFGVPESRAGLVAVGTQVGYALGILFLTPLVDIAQPARLLRWLIALTSASLALAAFAPNISTLAVASLVLSVTTIVPQVLISLAPSMAAPERRGQMVGAMMTGLVSGILLSRTAAGLIAEAAGSWRASYIAAACLTGALFFLLPRFLPERPPRQDRIGYGALLSSLPDLLAHPRLRVSMGINFFTFAAFSGVWASLAFHLQGEPFSLGPAAIGLFGLWGAPGALLAPMVGRLADRWGAGRVNLLGVGALAAALALAASVGATHVLAVVVALNFLDFGQQSGQVANQTRIFGIDPLMRGRLNTLYMTASFTGGALGSFSAAYAWGLAGWAGVCGVAGVFVAGAAVVLVLGRRQD